MTCCSADCHKYAKVKQATYCLLLCQVWKARCKTTGEDVAVKLLDLENLNCSLVGKRALAVINVQVRVHQLTRACCGTGGDCQGSTNNAAAASPKCFATSLLFCSSTKSVDGHAVRCWWFCAELDQVCLLRGEKFSPVATICRFMLQHICMLDIMPTFVHHSACLT